MCIYYERRQQADVSRLVGRTRVRPALQLRRRKFSLIRMDI